MIAPRYARKPDDNQKNIVTTLEALGCNVLDMSRFGGGFPDLLVQCRRELLLVEVKNPENWYGKKGLSDKQRRFATWWQGGQVYVVRTVDDCIALVQGDRDSLAFTPEGTDLIDMPTCQSEV